jgi:hypothetical protein
MDLGADGYDHDFGAGLVNAYAALTQSTMDRAVFAIKDSDGNWVGESVYGRRNRTFCISNASPGECTLVGFLDADGDHQISPHTLCRLYRHPGHHRAEQSRAQPK